LAKCDVSRNHLTLTGQLDRPTYVAVNKILDLMGGKWNRGAKAHVSPEPPEVSSKQSF
jgi:hypothetical protein